MARRGLMALAVVVAAATAATVRAKPADSLPKVVDVPSRPAFVQPPGRAESDARVGQLLQLNTLLRT
jgi:hypothetical protein